MGHSNPPTRVGRPSVSVLQHHPALEALEPRLMLSGTQYVVDSLADTVAADGVVTLREAIEAANTNTAVTTDVPAGSDTLQDVITFERVALWAEAGVPLDQRVTITLGGSQLEITDDLAILGLGADVLAVDADGQSRVFQVSGAETEVDLTGLTITGGQAGAVGGGGIYNDDGTVTLTNVTVSGNSVTGTGPDASGGGIYNGFGTLTLRDVTVSGNSVTGGASGSGGGGIFNYQGTVTLTSATVSGNSATGEEKWEYATGGGIYNVGGTLTLTDSTVSGNSVMAASYATGGGIRNDNDGAVTLTGSTVSDNSATDFSSGFNTGHGGGIYNGRYSMLTLTNSTVSGNSASRFGGGVYNFLGTVTLTDSTVSDNSATDFSSGFNTGQGGGIYSSGKLTLTSSTVSGNSAAFGTGGGILNDNGTVTLTNSTVSGNSAYNGGGVYSCNTLTLTNSTVSGNSAYNGGGGVYNEFGTLTLTNSTVSGNSAYNSGGGFYNYSGTLGTLTLNNTIVALNDAPTAADIHGDPTNHSSLVGGDPLFVRDPSDGGDGWGDDPNTPGGDESANDDYGDLRLLPTSGAIDAGDNGLLPADEFDLDGDLDVTEPLPLDLAGGPRVLGGLVDIGAYEGVTLVMDIIGAGVDALVTSGAVALGANASLEFVIAGGGDEFQAGEYTLIDAAGGLTGTFANVTNLGGYVSVNGDGLTYDEGAGTVTLTLDKDLNPADGNLDGQTDVSDRIIWNNNNFTFGTTFATGDWNNDGQTDVSDRIVWNNNNFTFATGAPAGAPANDAAETGSAEPRVGPDDGPAGQQAVELFGVSAALFAANQGQWADPAVHYAFDGNGANVLFTDTGPVFQVFSRETCGTGVSPVNDERGTGVSPVNDEQNGSFAQFPTGKMPVPHAEPTGETPVPRATQFSVQFDGANTVSPVGLEQTETVFNYHLGDQSTWRDAVPTYATVAYLGLYDGIDLHTRGRRDSLKYEFHVAPGADYTQISVSYTGIEGLSIDATGALHVQTELGELIDDTPYIYQDIAQARIEVAGAFELIDADTYTFTLTGEYDTNTELVIDPALSWSTYIGGGGDEFGHDIAVDGSGGVYVTGKTGRIDWVSGGFDTSYGGSHSDVLVVKLTADGSHAWSTYMGGDGPDYGCGIAVDGLGAVYVTGYSWSTNWTAGGFDTSHNGREDIFVAKLTSGGGHVWSTYMGGSNDDLGRRIALDGLGGVYVTGYTGSVGWVWGGYDTSYNHGFDAFAAKLTTDGAQVWSTYVGGSGQDIGYGIAVDDSGGVYVTGMTEAAGWTSGGFDTSFNGYKDIFIAKLTSAGDHAWSTYMGGNDQEYGSSVAVDGSGGVYVTGGTTSAGWASGGGDTSFNGQWDTYVAKLTSGGGEVWSTYMGGSGWDWGYDIVVVDDSGALYVVGETGSSGWVSGGFDTSHNGDDDVFVAKLTPVGAAVWSTYMGGSGKDRGRAVALDGSDVLYVTGGTGSSGWVSGGFDTSYNGREEMFVAKLTDVVPEPPDVDVWLVPRTVETSSDTSTTLPTSDRDPGAFWQIEACDYTVEIWVRSDRANPVGVTRGGLNVTFDPDYARAVSVDHASVFPFFPGEAIDNATGVVSIRGRSLATDMGDDEYVCMGRILFQGIAPVDEVAHEAGPYDMALNAAAGPSDFGLVGVGLVDADIQPIPDVDIRANIYDIDDNGQVNSDDFIYFMPAYGGIVGRGEPPFFWWADFDRHGQVRFNDFSYFPTAYMKSFCDPAISFPTWWHTTYVTRSAPQPPALTAAGTHG